MCARFAFETRLRRTRSKCHPGAGVAAGGCAWQKYLGTEPRLPIILALRWLRVAENLTALLSMAAGARTQAKFGSSIRSLDRQTFIGPRRREASAPIDPQLRCFVASVQLTDYVRGTVIAAIPPDT